MQHQLPKTLFSFICFFLKDYKLVVIIYIFLAITAGFLGPFNSILIKQIIDFLPSTTPDTISILIVPSSLIILNFIIFDNVTWRGLAYIKAKFVPLIINRIIKDLMNYLLKQSHQFYQDNLSGKISKQIINLSDGIERLIGNIIMHFLRGVSLLIMAFISAYFANPIFCFILIIWFIFFATASILMSKKLVFLSDAEAATQSIIVGEMVDSLSNHSNVRAFARGHYENLRMQPFLKQNEKAYTSIYIYSLIMHSVQGGLIAIMIGFLCYFLIYLYGKGLITIGDFALILGLSMETGHMMWFTMSVVDELIQQLGDVSKV